MAGISSTTPDSLLKYAPPLLVKKPRSGRVVQQARYTPLYAGIGVGDEVLDVLLQPREFEHQNGDYFVQRVSRTPATERDSEKLREDLDRRLFERGARMAGPCIIRRELYSQALDELIRQEAIACAETGILLAAWRDHCARNLAAYERLYVSRLVNENEKYLKLAQRKLDLHLRLTALTTQEQDLASRVTRAQARLMHACKAREERAQQDAATQQQETERLREDTSESMVQLKARLKEMKSGM